MSFDSERLFALLPAVYRIRDAKLAPAPQPGSEGPPEGPLQAWLGVIADQVAIIEEDLAQLYDDQFIETCADWVVPYLSELIGHPIRHKVAAEGINLRAEVANTIAYRRRKGTTAMLEQLARDTTGWNARVVEYFQLLGWSQHVNHVRKQHFYSPHMRDPEPLQNLNTPFDKLAHTIDVRKMKSDAGRYNTTNIGVHVWRLKSYASKDSTAGARRRPDARGPIQPDKQHFLFHPLGLDTPLFTNPQSEDAIAHLAGRINVAMPISRGLLRRSFSEHQRLSNESQELLDHNEEPSAEHRRQSTKVQKQLSSYYGPGKSFNVQVAIDGGDSYRDVLAEEIEIADLSKWPAPEKGKVAIDPVLGRIAFGDKQETAPRVTFHYGFSADIGGGDYDRFATFEPLPRPANRAAISVAAGKSPSLRDALKNAAGGGTIRIDDSATYLDDLAFSVQKNARIELRAADECRPVITSKNKDAAGRIPQNEAIRIEGAADSEVTLNGLLIDRVVRVSSKIRRLRLRHCTLVPTDHPSLTVESIDNQPANIEIEIDHCIVGALAIAAAAKVVITDSIVDGNKGWALADQSSDHDATFANTRLSVLRSTVLGKVKVHTLECAENSIFTKQIQVAQQPAGYMRFCYAPSDSTTPRRYRCQPDLSGPTQQGAQTTPANRMDPEFESTTYGDAGYCQLAGYCPDEIRRGADDHSEMGVFHDLFQPQREDALKSRLERYTRFGMQTKIFYVT